MKKFLAITLSIIAVLLVGGYLLLRSALGGSPGAVFDVAGGLAAKLGCSARHLTGLTPGQVMADLESYSSAYGLVRVRNIDSEGRVEAALPPGATHSATYRQGAGCTLDIGDTRALDELNLPRATGPDTAANSGELNELLQQQIVVDNQEGRSTRALLVMQNGEIRGEANASPASRRKPHTWAGRWVRV